MAALEPADRLAPIRRVAVPAGLAVLTWAVLLVVLGRLLRFGPLTLYSPLWLGAIGAMVWPIVAFAPWRDRPDERAAAWLRDHRRPAALTVALAGLVVVLRALDGPAFVLGVLVLPTDLLSGGLYATAAFYRDLVGPTGAAAVFRFARWYLLGLWLYAVATGLVVADRAVRGR